MNTNSAVPNRQAFHAPEQLRRAIAAIGSRRIVHAGEELFRQGDPVRGVFLVNSGKVKLSLELQQGSLLAEAGSVLGLPAAVRDSTYSLNATVVDDSELTYVAHQDMRKLLNSDSELCFQVVQILSGELQRLREQS